jgi:hypothetical protein
LYANGEFGYGDMGRLRALSIILRLAHHGGGGRLRSWTASNGSGEVRAEKLRRDNNDFFIGELLDRVDVLAAD